MPSKLFKRKGIIVIDDDLRFGRLISTMGRQRGLPIHFFSSLEDLGSIAMMGEYDVAILDFFLEEMNGLEIAEYLDCFFPGMPAILTSGNTFVHVDGKGIPNCVVTFVSKATGVSHILDVVERTMRKRSKSQAGKVG